MDRKKLYFKKFKIPKERLSITTIRSNQFKRQSYYWIALVTWKTAAICSIVSEIKPETYGFFKG